MKRRNQRDPQVLELDVSMIVLAQGLEHARLQPNLEGSGQGEKPDESNRSRCERR
jgi:hypothetical protein